MSSVSLSELSRLLLDEEAGDIGPRSLLALELAIELVDTGRFDPISSAVKYIPTFGSSSGLGAERKLSSLSKLFTLSVPLSMLMDGMMCLLLSVVVIVSGE